MREPNGSASAPRPQPGAKAPLFDRLIDQEPRVATETPALRNLDLEAFTLCVRRDVEDLLNTRRNLGVWHEPGRRSTLSFGVGDLTGLSSRDPGVRARAAKEVQEALVAFEPRLTAIAVNVGELASDNSTSLELRAMLRVGRIQIPVEWTIRRLDERVSILPCGGEL